MHVAFYSGLFTCDYVPVASNPWKKEIVPKKKIVPYIINKVTSFYDDDFINKATYFYELGDDVLRWRRL